MRHRGNTLLRALLAVFAALIAFGVTPALAAEPPATSKIVTSNDDGTYTLSLSVTGKSQASSSSSKADVIVALDTSGSMSYSATGGTRLSVAKSAVNSLAEELLSNNTTENPDAVQLSLVTFSNYATTRITGTTSLSGFQRQVTASLPLVALTGKTRWRPPTQFRRVTAPMSTSSLFPMATQPSAKRGERKLGGRTGMSLNVITRMATPTMAPATPTPMALTTTTPGTRPLP